MKKLLDLVRSERPLVAGTLGRFAGELGVDRAAARIVGFLILWAGPYLFGASYRVAWLFSILGYIALTIFLRRRDRVWRRPDGTSTRGWRTRVDARYPAPTNVNGVSRASQSQAGGETASATDSGPGSSTPAAGAEQPLGASLADLEQRLIQLDQRIQKMETIVTDRAFDWDRRLRKG